VFYSIITVWSDKKEGELDEKIKGYYPSDTPSLGIEHLMDSSSYYFTF